MTDGPIDRGTGTVRDNDGTTYEIEGDHAEGGPGEPRDATSGYPTGAFVAGGAGGTGTLGAASTGGLTSAASGSDSGELHPTSHGEVHSSVAESADLGQRPLRDYKRDGDASGADDTTMMADTTPAAARQPGSYVSDDDAGAGSTGTGTAAAAATTAGAATMSPRDQEPITMSTDTSAGSGAGMGRDSISMSNVTPIASTENETLTNVHEGYKVVDASGDEIGKVRDLRSGDTTASTTGPDDPDGRSDVDTSDADGPSIIGVPGAAGTGGSATSGTGLGGAIPVITADTSGTDTPFADDEPNVDEPAYTRLTRIGFIKIDSKGWFSKDRYAGADQIDRVEGETVYLNAGKDDLLPER